MSRVVQLSRRGVLRGAVALGGSVAFAAPIVASSTKPSDALLIETAKRELAKSGRRVWLSDAVGIADFSLPSYEPRFFLIDLVGGKVKPFLVAHGRGSDPEHDGWLKSFSNTPGSAATSRGAYVTHSWYQGKYGTSMRVSGLEADNDLADDRAIVIHSAWYANPTMIAEWGKLGRSEGCFAMPEANLMEVLAKLGPGRLLYADRLATA